MTELNMRSLLDAGTHFGHQTRNWSPKMAPYLFGQRQKIHIINLEKTLPLLVDATNYLGQVTGNGGVVLFVATKPQASRIVQQAAEQCGCPYVNHRWRGGTLTNFKTMQNSIECMKELAARLEPEAAAPLSKKDLLMLRRQHAKLHRALSGIANLSRLPDALFVIDIQHEHIAVKEATKLGIPIVAVVDSNCDPAPVDYVIPGNDDSTRSIELFLTAASEAISNAKAARSQQRPAANAEDEYVELDESGQVIETRKPGSKTPKRTTVKTAKAVKAETAKAAKAAAAKAPAADNKPAEPDPGRAAKAVETAQEAPETGTSAEAAASTPTDAEKQPAPAVAQDADDKPAEKSKEDDHAS